MNEYVYPAIFHANNDNSYTITFPDLQGCISEGKTLGSAMSMAQTALTQWVEYLTEKNQLLPAASSVQSVTAGKNEFVNLVRADIKDGRAVRRTVSIPKWMDDKVSENGLSLSRVLQDALKERLHVN